VLESPKKMILYVLLPKVELVTEVVIRNLIIINFSFVISIINNRIL